MPALPLDRIRVAADFNPRSHFDSTGLEELKRSLSENGQVQALSVRPDPANDGHYILIAGERRYRSMRELGWTECLAEILAVDERHARVLAVEENLVRVDLSPAEEARTLRTLLDAYDGDRSEVGRRLGWSATKMASRLALLHAAPAVLDALAAGEILLGHAELLAGVGEAQQIKALARIKDERLTITQVRDALSAASIPLDTACFDRRDCEHCPHNSSVQGTLFSVSIDAGRCSQRQCFQTKTEEALSVQRAELEERFAVVALASERDKGTTAPVSEAVVGPARWSGCLGCAKFGAVVEDRLGPTCGRATTSMCFDMACREQKLAARALELAPPPPSQPVTDAVTPPSEDAPSPQTPAIRADAPVAIRAAVQESFDGWLRTAAVAAMSKPEVGMAILCLAVQRLLSVVGASAALDAFVEERVGKSQDRWDGKLGHSPALVSRLSLQPREALQAALMGAAQAFVASKPGVDTTGFDRKALVAALVEAHGIDLAPYVQIDAAFLSSLTVSEIMAVLEESGFKAKVLAAQEGEAKWKGLAKLNKAGLVAAVAASRYDFTGYVPTLLRTHAARRRAGK